MPTEREIYGAINDGIAWLIVLACVKIVVILALGAWADYKKWRDDE